MGVWLEGVAHLGRVRVDPRALLEEPGVDGRHLDGDPEDARQEGRRGAQALAALLAARMGLHHGGCGTHVLRDPVVLRQAGNAQAPSQDRGRRLRLVVVQALELGGHRQGVRRVGGSGRLMTRDFSAYFLKVQYCIESESLLDVQLHRIQEQALCLSLSRRAAAELRAWQLR